MCVPNVCSALDIMESNRLLFQDLNLLTIPAFLDEQLQTWTEDNKRAELDNFAEIMMLVIML